MRNAKGQFGKGASGNPSGRPKSDSAIIRAALAQHGIAVAEMVVKAAMDGDLQACKLVLDRISPPLKAQSYDVNLLLPESLGLSETAQFIIRAAAKGEVSPDVATQLVRAVGDLARITETEELKNRLESLERAIKGTKV